MASSSEFHRLADIVVHPGRETFLAVALQRIGRHRDYDGVPRPLSSSRRRNSAVAVKPSISGHHAVHQDQRISFGGERLEGLGAVSNHLGRITEFAQLMLDDGPG